MEMINLFCIAIQQRYRRRRFLELVQRYERRRRPRLFLPRIGLHTLSDREIVRRFRLNRGLIENLYLEIKDSIEPITYRTKAIPGMLKLLAVLYFLATGSFQAVTSLVVGMSQASFSSHLTVVLKALHQRIVNYVHFPETPEDWHRVKVQFYGIAGMTNILGAIDCTHVLVQPPKLGELPYRDRKRNHSLNIQVISDAKLKIMSIRSGFPGSTHDSFILRNSHVYDLFQNHQMPEGILLDKYLLLIVIYGYKNIMYFILLKSNYFLHTGDSGYSCLQWLFTPVLNPRTPAQVRYNEAHTSTRCVIERTFGVLKSRFRCLDLSGGVLLYKPKKVSLIFLICCMLHNLALRMPDADISMLQVEYDDNVAPLEQIDASGVQARSDYIHALFEQ
ncbi:putative nuclease HARBI1 [Bombina bombina]|uniref:putative nuclease HARBI1 n=1 Tax=Bombina bombina TaxID=8345 RepID=UPI00235A6D36|nr:putative nuclease HARBI1 [Bombina bombina]